MARFFERLSEASMSWLDGLSDRDRRLLGIISTGLSSLLVIFVIVFLVTNITTKRAQLNRNLELLTQIKALESDFMDARQKNEQAKRRIKSNDVSLFTFIQGTTKRLGLTVKDLSEQSRTLPKSEIVEVSVKLNLSELSIDKVTALIEELEQSEDEELVKVTKLKVTKRYDKPKLLDLQMTVSTWKSA